MFCIASCTKVNSDAQYEIENVMKYQEECWNKGDIDCFMQGYWNSDSLLFVSKNGITKGWNATLNNYKNKYSSPEQMGKLTFSILKLETNNNNAFMIGKWQLNRTNDNIGGYFTLYWKKIDSKWKIIADHTS